MLMDLRASAEAIEQGVRTALSEVGERLAGRPVEVVFKNHRGNSRRSKRHLDDYLSDDSALAVFAGMHSPPLLAHRDFINENAILMLVAWAAAGPITRSPAPENWTFRLSVDDTKAGHFIAEHAVQMEGFQRPFLLLEDTGWGRSNHLTMSKALAGLAATQGVRVAGVQWFNWNIGENQARAILRKVARSEADVIFLVANAPEAVVFAHAILAMEASVQRPIRSHWGISGGNFTDIIDHQMRSRLDLAFIQTRYPFLDGQLNAFQADVLARAARLYPRILGSPSTMKAPAGFFHGYDLTRLLISAAEQAGLDGDILAVRRRVRAALENLERPVQGLMKCSSRDLI